MLQNERMSLNALKMCSLGELVIMRNHYIGSDYVQVVDYEIFSRIPNHQIVKTKQKRKRIVKKRRRG